ncbi:MAG TPA: methyl-accepting chemotaxis protein [Anaerolineae bacterium]|nr:methyl-accepting chemotaxis protein [Anaerolineae bacterium]
MSALSNIHIRSIQAKIALWAGCCLTFVAVILTIYSVTTAREKSINEEQEEALTVAQAQAGVIHAEMGVALDAARTLAQSLSGVKTANLELTRAEVNAMLRQVLKANPRFLAVYTLWEPNAFDGNDADYVGQEGHDTTGRFIPYWVRSDGQIILEPLLDYAAEGIGDYYLIPKRTGQEAVLDPYLYPVDGVDVLITSLVAPIVVDGQFYGIAGVDVRLDSLQEVADNIEVFEGSGQLVLVSHNGTLAGVTGQPELVGQRLDVLHPDDFEEDLALIQGGEAGVDVNGDAIEVFTPIQFGRTETPWSVSLLISQQAITAGPNALMLQMIGISALLIVAGQALIWFAAGRIARPIKRIAVVAQALARGDLNQPIEIQLHDELGQLAEGFRSMREAVRGLVAEAKMLTEAAVAGRLATRGDASKFQGAYREVVQGVNDTLDAVIGPLNVAAEYMDRISQGEVPPQITETYQGDFNAIKNNLNLLIKSTHQMAGVAQNIAAGDLSAHVEVRSENDVLAKSMGLALDALRNVVNEMQTLTEAAVQGRLATRGDAGKFQGAYRAIVQGVNDTLDAVITPIKDTQEILGRIARGDLLVQLNGHYQGDYALLKSSIESMAEGLKAVALQTQQTASNTTSATAEILASSTQMAASTREQASAVNQITSTVQEIKASAGQVAQRAQAVAETASQAMGAAEKGIRSIQDTITSMEDIRSKVEAIAENILALSEQTQQIGDIIDTVTDIAGQSNILALNAAIEAAQAGEAGKGFRVVADEVRSLAEQSRQAAAQVKVILGDIQKATNLAVMATEQGTKGVNAGSERVNSTDQTIREIARAVEVSAQAAQQIVAGVEQQTIGLDQIAIGMSDINQAAQQTAIGAQQSQAAAQELNQFAEQLKQAAAQYRL